MGKVITIILAGGRGTRLYPLTKMRSKPAVPIAGKFRLIDIPISNCIHSGLRKIFILTQFSSESLHRHIFKTHLFDNFSKDFITILSAQQTTESLDWYQGTADAVRQNMRLFREKPTWSSFFQAIISIKWIIENLLIFISKNRRTSASPFIPYLKNRHPNLA